eukprot:scaffold3936_cov128-Isochrysis_galbana.AAC.8
MCCCCLRPHTITPLPWRERGIQFPQHKNKHTSQARGDEARKAQGGGERNLHLVFRGRWTIARGPSHTPFGGVGSLASTYRRCGANWAPPYNSYSHRGGGGREAMLVCRGIVECPVAFAR